MRLGKFSSDDIYHILCVYTYMRKVMELQHRGVITDVEASKLREGVDHLAKLLGWADLAARVEALEAQNAAKQEAGEGVKVVAKIHSEMRVFLTNTALK
jgi:hypothetical protein